MRPRSLLYSGFLFIIKQYAFANAQLIKFFMQNDNSLSIIIIFKFAYKFGLAINFGKCDIDNCNLTNAQFQTYNYSHINNM